MSGNLEREYRAAVEGLALVVHADRRWLLASGKAPAQMLAGMVSGRLPPEPAERGPGLLRGRAESSALLDSKGKMLAELRVLREAGGVERLLLELTESGFEGALAHLRKFLPPRLARLEDVSAERAVLSVLGPGAGEALSRDLLGGVVATADLDALAEGDAFTTTGREGGDLAVIRTLAVATPAWDLVVGSDSVGELAGRLTDAGAYPAGYDVWETLRVEAGRPAYGPDLDQHTIPAEAGVEGRLVDYTKGCFTGQEVLVRIRDRGHVNRRLRGLRLGSLEKLPQPGSELLRAEDGKAVGQLTTVVRSPRFGEVVALGWVRREVAPPAELRLGEREGPPVRVADLASGWRP